ncbi:MAG: ComEC/Rec2 family competence protein [Cyclobacteriaceae bacterium]
MHFWSAFPFVRITLAFAIGIVVATYSSFELRGDGFLVEIVLLGFGVGLLLFKRLLKFSDNILGYLSIILVVIGAFYFTSNTKEHEQEYNPDIVGYKGNVAALPEQKGDFVRAELSLQYLLFDNSIEPADGKVLIYVKRDTLHKKPLKYGDDLIVRSTPNGINGPTNPGEFNFASYWGQKGIYLQDFIEFDEITILGNSPQFLVLAKAYDIRQYCKETITESIDGQHEEAIVLALVLGIKEGLDNTIKEAYAAAGAMHVLAVSGLHVGILYLFILYLFRPIRNYRFGNLITGLVSLLILWTYALVTGFSPSVQRAVVMFSIFIIGRLIKRQRNIYNSLAFSAFILLLINPLMLFEVGFQLSYLAVFGIVFLQPKLYRLWSPRYWIINKGWEITCVSIAAQLATFPLGLYYFHQFPTLFLLSNLAVIPTAFFILILGLTIILTASIGLEFIQGIIGNSLEWVVWLLNRFVIVIDSFEYSLIEAVNLNELQIVIIYVALLLIWALFTYRKLRFLIVATVFLSVVSGIEIAESATRASRKEIVFYNINKLLAIDFRDGHDVSLYISDSSESDDLIRFNIKPDRIKNGLRSNQIGYETFDKWDSVGSGIQVKIWNSRRLLRLTTKEISKISVQKKLDVDYLILSNNCCYDLSDVLKIIQPQLIIVDGSNSYWMANKLVEDSPNFEIPLHNMKEYGALTVEW